MKKTVMRRKEKEVKSSEEMKDILSKAFVCRIGLQEGAFPYIVPMNFGWECSDDNFIVYIHCADSGRKLNLIMKCQRAGEYTFPEDMLEKTFVFRILLDTIAGKSS